MISWFFYTTFCSVYTEWCKKHWASVRVACAARKDRITQLTGSCGELKSISALHLCLHDVTGCAVATLHVPNEVKGECIRVCGYVHMCMRCRGVCAAVLTVCWCCCGGVVVPSSREIMSVRCVCEHGLCGTALRHIVATAVAAGRRDTRSEALPMKPAPESSSKEM